LATPRMAIQVSASNENIWNNAEHFSFKSNLMGHLWRRRSNRRKRNSSSIIITRYNYIFTTISITYFNILQLKQIEITKYYR
jgi:hypothetical protein